MLVRPKEGILDPAGGRDRPLAGGSRLSRARRAAGRVFDLELDVETAEEAERVAREIAGRVLANDLIERFDVVVQEPVA